MKEIKNAKQKSCAQGSKKLFIVSWLETQHCFTEVQAKNKEEVLALFHRGDDKVRNNVQLGDSEIIGEPSVIEVPDDDKEVEGVRAEFVFDNTRR